MNRWLAWVGVYYKNPTNPIRGRSPWIVDAQRIRSSVPARNTNMTAGPVQRSAPSAACAAGPSGHLVPGDRRQVRGDVGVLGNELVGGSHSILRANAARAGCHRALLSYNGPVIRDFADSKPAARISRQAAIPACAAEPSETTCPVRELILAAHIPSATSALCRRAGWLGPS